MPDTTPRMGLTTPLGSEGVNIDQHLKNLADAVDANAAMFSQGTLGARPTSTPGSPGKTGRLYFATDNGKVYYDYGTGWTLLNADIPTLGPDSITSTEIAPNAVGNSEMADNAVGSAEIIDGSVGTAEIANALKPSAGAGGATEALRAIGSGAGNVIAGNDARLTEGAAGSQTVRSLGSGATQAAPGNDARLSDARIPKAIPIATSLPASPANGDIAILVDSLTAPTYSWTFQYVSGISDAYKWIYIGGAPYVASANPNADFTLPRAGMYIVEAVSRNDNDGTATPGFMDIIIQSPVGTTLQTFRQWQASDGQSSKRDGTVPALYYLTVAASQVVRAAGSNTDAVYLKVTPRRLS